MSACPSREQLDRLLSESLSESERSVLEDHLRACPACLTHLDLMTRDGEIERLRRLQAGRLETCSPDRSAAPAPAAVADTRIADVDADRAGQVSPLVIPGYELLGELGRGGMGIVYKARHRGLNRVVALKVILAGVHATPAERERFRAEAEAAARVHHPHIVQVYEIGEHDGLQYLALEYVAGTTMADWLAEGPKPPRRVAELLELLARAVHAAHTQGVVHRDLKPANVLLDLRLPIDDLRLPNTVQPIGNRQSPIGNPKIADFGLARQLDQAPLTRTSNIAGTPSYMAPEQATGKRELHGPNVDVYALGAMLYESLTGQPPFRGDSAYHVLLQVVHDDPAPPRRLRPSVPRDLETICLKCLHKDPALRYASAFALADDLHRFLEDRPIAARPVGLAKRVLKWSRRRPAVAGLAAAVALAIVLGLTLALTQWRAAEQRADADRAQARQEQTARRTIAGMTASILIDQGQQHGERGEIAAGLMQFVRAAELATDAQPVLEEAARLNLAAWSHYFARPRCSVSHPSWVWTACLTRDKKTLVTGCLDKKVRFCDVASGRLVGEALEFADAVWAVALHPDQKTLLIATGAHEPPGPGAVQLWDWPTRRPLGATLALDSPIVHAAFRPDGATFVTVTRGQAQVWSTHGQTCLRELTRASSSLATAALSPDGGKLWAIAVDGSLTVWDLDTGLVGARLSQRPAVSAAAFGPDGQRLAVGGMDGVVRVLDAATGQVLGSTASLSGPGGLGGPVLAVAYSPAGDRLAVSSVVPAFRQSLQPSRPLASEVRLLHVPSCVPATVPWRHVNEVGALAFSPRGDLLVAGGIDGKAHLLNCGTGRPFANPLESNGNVRLVAFAEDGRSVLAASAGSRAAVWDLPDADHAIQSLPSDVDVRALAFPLPGDVLLLGCADGSVRFLDVDRGELTARQLQHGAPVKTVLVSPGGAAILTLGGKSARLWDAAGGRLLHDWPHEHNLFAGVFTADGKTVATGSWGGTITLWDVASGRKLRALDQGMPVLDLDFDPHQGDLFATSEAKHLLRWRQGADHPTKDCEGNEDFLRLAFHPHQRLAATVSLYEGSVQLWDLARGRAQGPRLGRVASGSSHALFSPDGKWLLAGGFRALRVWHVATGKELGPERIHHAPVDDPGAHFDAKGQSGALAHDPRGRYAVVALGNKLQYWAMPNPPPATLEELRQWVEELTGQGADAPP